MQTMAARQAKQAFGTLLERAQSEPVTVERRGRPVVVVLAYEDYERLEARLEDAWWEARAEEAAKEGFIGPEESEKLLQELLDAAA